MEQNWNNIFNKNDHSWNKKVKKNYVALYKVIYPKMTSENVENYMKYLFKKKKFKSFFDFGSGNGAILLYVKEKLNCKKLYSHDISKNFLDIQKKNFSNKITFIDPDKIKSQKTIFDLTLCNSVFQYFDNKKKAFNSIEKLINISQQVIISDLISTNGYQKFLKEKNIREGISSKEFKKKYKNLNHLTFFKKDFLYLKKKFKVNLLFNSMPYYHPDAINRFLVYIKK